MYGIKYTKRFSTDIIYGFVAEQIMKNKLPAKRGELTLLSKLEDITPNIHRRYTTLKRRSPSKPISLAIAR
jgi:hypothetical protein